jgi:two-component system OmpR family response regulator
MSRILLMEDDEVLSATIFDILKDEGYDVTLTKDGESALEATYAETYDLYLLDVNVPLINGFDFLKSLRESGDETPAFFITALRDTASLSLGFDSGADDYIKKPFEIDELLVRIKALMKRRYGGMVYNDIVYDPVKKEIKKADRAVDLPNLEKEIFDLFMKNIGNTVTKEQFYDVMEQPSDMSLRVHISQIKKRLGLEITNIRGIGYRLEKV